MSAFEMLILFVVFYTGYSAYPAMNGPRAAEIGYKAGLWTRKILKKIYVGRS